MNWFYYAMWAWCRLLAYALQLIGLVGLLAMAGILLWQRTE